MLELFDVLRDAENARTYFVAAKEQNFPMQAVLCNMVLTITRPSTDSSQQTVAEDIPSYMLNTRLEMKTPHSMGGVQTAAQPLSHWRVQIPLREGTLKQFDILTDQNGVQYTINVVDFQRIGYVCEASLVL